MQSTFVHLGRELLFTVDSSEYSEILLYALHKEMAQTYLSLTLSQEAQTPLPKEGLEAETRACSHILSG